LPTIACSLMLLQCFYDIVYAQSDKEENSKPNEDEYNREKKGSIPKLQDLNLKLETVVEGLDLPTGMAFLGPDDIIVLEKNTGKVWRILNGEILEQPILDVSVTNKYERGLLGVAVTHDRGKNSTTYVFLYFTESSNLEDGKDDCQVTYYCNPSQDPTVGNRLYRYEFLNGKLINPKLLLDLPAGPGPSHNGGAIAVSPYDDNLYLTIGDINGNLNKPPKTKAQNYMNGTQPDGRGGILRISQEGRAAEGILGDEHPLDMYYAYGIRNSFGIDFDPVTGNLWNTENGPYYGDEINLVEPGFNSGWVQVQGIWKPRYNQTVGDLVSGDGAGDPPANLEDFGGKGNYSSPEFVWHKPVGPTTLKFLTTQDLGKEYENDMFVGETNGRIYHFDLRNESNRTALSLTGSLGDNTAENMDELNDITFGRDFGIITDMEIGPGDGYLYVLGFSNGEIYRIAPLNDRNL
jgi:glucose/arabinose dehydrogenase